MLQRVVGRLGLDHEDVDLALVVLAPGHDHVERRQVEVLVGGVDLPLAVQQADARRGDRAVERQTREGDGEAGTVDGGDVVEVGHVRRKDGGHDVHLLAEPAVERRTERPVDQPCGEGRGLARPALAAEEAAGDLADGVHPLLDVDREREEVDALPGPRRWCR